VQKNIANQAGIKVKDDLDIKAQEKVLVLSPHVRRAYRLEDLTQRITPRNVHKELAFGRPMGRETL
jgi:antitoxin component of MazEF toxin-antitoxin module